MAYRIPNDVLKFANGKLELYEMFGDYWNHYRANNGKNGLSFATVNREGKPITFEQKEAELNAALKRRIIEVSGVSNFDEFPVESWASNPSILWATFAVVNSLVDMVLPEAIVDSVGMYAEVRTGGFGDSFVFDIKPRDLFVVSKAGRGKRVAELQTQFTGQQSIVPEPRMVSVYVSLYRVLSGHESLAEFVMKAIRSMEAEMTRDTFTVWNTAVGSLPTSPAGGELRYAGYSQESLIKLAQRVTAWNNGQKAIVVGTQLALQNILPTNANYRYTLDSEYVKIGYIPTAFGYDIMALPQAADWTTPFKLFLDDTKIYVVSPSAGKPTKLCIEGSTLSNTTGTFDAATLTQSTTLMKSWKSGVITSAVAGVITLA